MTQQEAVACVANGAALLDRECPGWARDIDTSTLDISSDCHCVLGQLYGLFSCGASRLLHETVSFSDRERFPLCAAHGFFWADDSRVLNDAWIEAIADRLIVTAQPAPALTPQESIA